MLSANTNKDAHMVDAGWFSHKVIDNVSSTILKCDMFQLQSKSVNWFEKSHIVIPINIRNIHWILVIVNIKEKTWAMNLPDLWFNFFGFWFMARKYLWSSK